MKDKIPFYEIVNKFFVGAVFTILLGFFIVPVEKQLIMDFYNQYSTVLKDWSVILTSILIILVYEIGFLINRTSSIIVALILYRTKIWPKKDYGIDVSIIKQENPTFSAMITELVHTRSQILVFILLLIPAVKYHKWIWVGAFIAFIIILILSGKKHCDRMNKIREDYKKEHEIKLPNKE